MSLAWNQYLIKENKPVDHFVSDIRNTAVTELT